MFTKGTFEYWKADDEQWYWHLKAANNRIVAQSEGYTTKRNCLKGIRITKRSFLCKTVDRDNG